MATSKRMPTTDNCLTHLRLFEASACRQRDRRRHPSEQRPTCPKSRGSQGAMRRYLRTTRDEHSAEAIRSWSLLT
jgi:hypothetical protein